MRDISNTQLRRLDLTLLMVLDGALRHRKLTTVAQQLRSDAAGDQSRLDQAARHSGRSAVRSPRQRHAADSTRARPRSAGRAGAHNLTGCLAAGPTLRPRLRQPRVPHCSLGLRDCYAGARFPGALQHHRARLPPGLPHLGVRGGAGGTSQWIDRPYPRTSGAHRAVSAAHADGGGFRGAGATWPSDHRPQARPGALSCVRTPAGVGGRRRARLGGQRPGPHR